MGDYPGSESPWVTKNHPNENYRAWVYQVYSTDWRSTGIIGYTFSIKYARDYCLEKNNRLGVDGPAYNFEAVSLNDVRPTHF